MSDQDQNTNPASEDTEETIGFVSDTVETPVEETVVEETVTTTSENTETEKMDTDDLEVIPNSSGEGMTAMQLESMIHRNLAEIDKLREQLKTQKDMYESTIENDAAYAQQAEKEKEVKKATAAVKQKLTKQPAVIDINNRMKDIKTEIKDIEDTISGLAEQYEQVSGTNQILKEDGEVLEIVKIYKLRKKKKDE